LARAVAGGPPPRAAPPRPCAAGVLTTAGMTRQASRIADLEGPRRTVFGEPKINLLNPALPFPAVRRPLQRLDQDARRCGIARRLTGDDDLVARLQRRPRDRILRQLAHRTPLERPALRRPVLVGHVNLHERMRIAPDELGDDTLDFNLLRGIVFRGKRV